LKVAISGGPLGWAVDDSMVKGFLSLATALTCAGFGAIPRQMGLKVALTESHVVNQTRVEFVETHDPVRFEKVGVPISCLIRGGSAPLFHQEVAALGLPLEVGLARWWVWIGLEE